MELYRQACNFVSDYVFNHNFEFTQSRLNQALYTDMWKKFKIKSQMAQSAIRTVVARYKTVRIQMARKPYRYQDVNTGKCYAEPRDLTWLRQPISFNPPQVDLQRGRDKDGVLTINTIHG